MDCKLSVNGMLSSQIRQTGLHWKECGEYIKGSYYSFILHAEGAVTGVFCSYWPYSSRKMLKNWKGS